MTVPDSLAGKMELWRRTAQVESYADGLFFDQSWIAVYLGQGYFPEKHDTRVAQVDPAKVKMALDRLRQAIDAEVATMPAHDEYLRRESARLADAA